MAWGACAACALRSTLGGVAARELLSCEVSRPHNAVCRDRIVREGKMCRNIKLLFNFQPPVTRDEIAAASLQFVRKVSGFNKPSKANEVAFNTAVEEVSASVARLMGSLQTLAPPRDRLEEATKHRARSELRFLSVK